MADEKPTRTDLAAQRFKNSRIGLVLLVIIAVFAIMASFLEDFEVVRCWQGADLIVETLEVQNSVSPLAGLEPRKTEDGELAFVEGFMIQVPIRHNQCSDASILIRGLKVDIAESSINSTPSAVNLEELPPQGANVSHGFLAVLNDESAQSVTWTLADSRTTRGRNVENLMNTTPPLIITLNPNDDVEIINGVIRSLASTSTRIRLTLMFDTDGKIKSVPLGSVLVIQKGSVN